VGVRSYTKKYDGTLRKMHEPRESVPVFLESGLFGVGAVLLLDDVMSGGQSLEDLKDMLKRFGVERLMGVVGFSKNMQGGMESLNRSDSGFERVVACVEVEAMNGTVPVVRRWWEE